MNRTKIVGMVVVLVALGTTVGSSATEVLNVTTIKPFPDTVVGGNTYNAIYSFKNSQPTNVEVHLTIQNTDGGNEKASFNLAAKLNGEDLTPLENDSAFVFEAKRIEGVGTNTVSLYPTPRISIQPKGMRYELTIISTEGWNRTIQGNGTIDLRDEIGTLVEVNGSGTVSVYKLEEGKEPKGGFTNSVGKYVDVSIPDPGTIDEIIVRLYYTDAEISGKDENTMVMYWYNGADWVKCSDTGVDTTANYVWTRITSTTVPNLAELTESVFGVYGLPVVSAPRYISTGTYIPRDSDGDGLSDIDEIYKWHTDPYNPDTDGDGVSDGDEVKQGTNPNVPDNIQPAKTPTPVIEETPVPTQPSPVSSPEVTPTPTPIPTRRPLIPGFGALFVIISVIVALALRHRRKAK